MLVQFSRVLRILLGILFVFSGEIYAQTTLNVGASGDHLTIQDAVDAAADDDIIQVETGTYPESIVITDINGLTIKAADGATPVIDGSSFARGTTLLEFAPTSDGAIQDVRIEGLTFKNIPIPTSGNASSGHGIAMYTTNSISDIKIISNTFDNTDAADENHRGAGIVLDNVDDLLIENNTLLDAALYSSATPEEIAAITLHHFPRSNSLSVVTVRGNVIDGATRGIWVGRGGPNANVLFDNVLLENNTFSNIDREGVRADSEADGGDETLVIRNNEFIGTRRTIRIGHSNTTGGNVTVTENTIHTASDQSGNYGISVEGGNVTIEDNDITEKAIGVTAASNAGTLTVSSNTFSDNDKQVELADGLTGSISGILSDNEFDRSVTIQQPAGTIVSPNIFSSIQDAVDDAESGNTIQVMAGTYDEAITIGKSLSLLGANAGINPNTGTRSDEAVIEGTITIGGGIGNVTIDGIYLATELELQEGAIVIEGGNNVAVKNVILHDTPTEYGTYGIHTKADNNVLTVEDSKITGHSLGIYEYAASVTVTNSEFSKIGEVGINLAKQDLEIINSVISVDGSAEGVPEYASVRFGQVGHPDGTLSIEDSDLSSEGDLSNYSSVVTRGSGNEGHTIRNSTLSGGVDNRDDTVVDAKHNFWGSSGGPSSDQVSGNVDVGEWCTDMDCTEFAEPPPITVCSSGCDFQEIQDAVDAVDPDGSVQVEPGDYQENVVVGTAGIEIIGESGTRILVQAGETGINITASDVTIEGFEIIGPYDQDYVEVDWDSESSQTYGIELQSGATDATIKDNTIRDVRTGVQVLSNADDATISGNTIDNTKGSILLRSDVAALTGNSPGSSGNEWDIVILTSLWSDAPASMNLLPDQDDLSAYGSAVMSLSENNGGMTILDRRFGDKNRSHAVVEEGHNPGPKDDFGLGNGLGNPRQPYGAIQHGITALAEGGVVTVLAGTYTESLTIETPGITVTSSAGASVEGQFDLFAPGITVTGFDITNPSGGYGIIAFGVGDIEISNNTIHDIGTDGSLTNPTAQGITVADDDGTDPFGDIVIKGNTISDIGHDQGGGSNKGIFIGDSQAEPTLSNVTISDNTIQNVTAKSDAVFADGGKGAYGIQINYGTSSSGTAEMLIIDNNTISDMTGFWARGIGLETNTPDATVTNNSISDLKATKVVDEDGNETVNSSSETPSGAFRDEIALFFGSNSSADGITVEKNRFSDSSWGVFLFNSPDVDASNNWWGDPNGPDSGAEAGSGVSFSPWYINQDLTQLSTSLGVDDIQMQVQPSGTTAGQPIGGPPSVLVTNSLDDPVEGVNVTVSLSGDADFDSGTLTVPTDDDGEALFDDLVINTAGSYTLTFEVGGGDEQVTSKAFKVVATEASDLSITTQPTESVAGEPIEGPPAVLVSDSQDNPVAGVTVKVSLKKGGSFDDGTLTAATGSDGTALFDDLVINTAGSYTLIFKVDGLDKKATSKVFKVVATEASSLSITTQPTDGVAGDSVGGPPAVLVSDSQDNPVADVTVTVSLQNGGAFDDGTLTAATGSDGTALFDDLVINTAGSYRLVFTVAGEITVQSAEFLLEPDISVPSAPLNLIAEPGNRQVNLSWDEPADIGGEPIIRYIVEYAAGPQGSWTEFQSESPAETSVTVSGLVNNIRHRFRVSAENIIGTGPVSELTSSVPVAPIFEEDEEPPPPLPPGGAVSVINGEEVPVARELVDESTMELGGEGFKLSFSSVSEDGEPETISNENDEPVFNFEPGGSMKTGGGGFAPGSSVALWLFSTPRLLGFVDVDENGNFVGDIPIPRDIEVRSHTLRIQGVRPTGEEQMLALGVEVKPNRRASVSALDRITGYASSDGAGTTPSVSDFSDLGILGVTSENLDAILAAIAAVEGEEADAIPEIRVVVDEVLAELALNRIRSWAATGGTSDLPAAEDYENAGVTGVTEENIDRVNSAVADADEEEAGSPETIQQIVDDVLARLVIEAALGRIRSWAETGGTSDPLSVDDYETAGITGVTKENIGEVNIAIADTDEEDVDSAEKIQAIVDTVLLHLSVSEYNLLQNYPNPFRNTTTIEYHVLMQADVTITVYDILGRPVETLIRNPNHDPGVYEAYWNVNGLASGIYIYRMTARGSNGETFRKDLKLVMVK